jgi:hypothetical protein
MRSVNGLSANAGIFLVEVYIFKFISRESKLEYCKRDSSKISSFGSCFRLNKKGGAPKKCSPPSQKAMLLLKKQPY